MIGNRIKNSLISDKIEKIMKEGVRKNTRAPVSKKNPRVMVSQKRAEAIAESMYRQAKKHNSLSKFRRGTR